MIWQTVSRELSEQLTSSFSPGNYPLVAPSTDLDYQFTLQMLDLNAISPMPAALDSRLAGQNLDFSRLSFQFFLKVLLSIGLELTENRL